MEARIPTEFYVGQRLALKGQLCTVRFVGPVLGRPGVYLGVEWDDPTRGKHAGTHDGTAYFSCRSRSPTAASFLRPTQPWEASRSFLSALREKYMSENTSSSEVIYISGKEAEKIGFEKFARRQKQLLGIHVLVLDGMRIRHTLDDEDLSLIPEMCAEITDLDLGKNLFESLDEILDLARRLPKLKSLTLDGNRISIGESTRAPLHHVHTLNLRSTLLDAPDISAFLPNTFPSLKALSLASNDLLGPLDLHLPPTLDILDLTKNNLASLSDIQFQKPDPSIQSLILKQNAITSIGRLAPPLPLTLRTLDLSYNALSTWATIDDLNSQIPELHHLRTTGNALPPDLSTSPNPASPPDQEAAYMLTLARLPALQTLNYSTITAKERLDAETFYLSRIAAEARAAAAADAATSDPRAVLARHPRWPALCAEYGEPDLAASSGGLGLVADANALAARMIAVTCRFAGEAGSSGGWEGRVPRSWSVYALLGWVAGRLEKSGSDGGGGGGPGVMAGRTPLDLKLVLESGGGEGEAVAARGGAAYAGPEWWNSDDEDGEAEGDRAGESEGLVLREIELVPGTRTLATYVEGPEATIRVQLRMQKQDCL